MNAAPTAPDGQLAVRWLAPIAEQLAAARGGSIGYPGATDVDFGPLLPIQSVLINNVGDPETSGRWTGHVKEAERRVIGSFVEMFGGDPQQCWGYVTSGGSEGVLHGLWLGREAYPQAHLYFSAAAHYSVAKAARLLRLEHTVIGVDAGGQIRYRELAAAVHRRRGRPALVVATAGTTMTEAIDRVELIHAALDEAGVGDRRFVSVDAALSGPGLALDGVAGMSRLLAGPAARRVAADHLSFSGHKSFGTPHVCAVSLTRREHARRVTEVVDYLGGTDSTVSGSRGGHGVLELAWVLDSLGFDGLRQRARGACRVAEYAVTELHRIGWTSAWRWPHAWTVVLAPPGTGLAERWSLPESAGVTHLVCAPGVDETVVDSFVADLAADLAADLGAGSGPRPVRLAREEQSA